MCGVAAIFAYHPASPPAGAAELAAISARMATRGPDGAGSWFDPDGRLALGHRRLAIIDLDRRAAQPMASACGRFVISFNGEIYNYRELRAELVARGCRFRTTSDTEVLVELFARDGKAALSRLRGMFAFALWDERERVLWLARDPFGIKPLYYADDGWMVRAASQVKALLAGRRRVAQPGARRPGRVLPLRLGPRAFHLLPGYPGRAGRGAWSASTPSAPMPRSPSRPSPPCCAAASGQCPPQTRARRSAPPSSNSVRHHLVADVPVGLFLSSGIDSGALLALMTEVRGGAGEPIRAVTVAFPEYCGRSDDEAPLAAELAARFGAEHTIRLVGEDEFAADLPRILDAMDQPTIDGVNTWFVSKAARELGLNVALSGLGGDELFAGYPSFRDLPRWVRTLGLPSRVPLAGRALRALLSPLGAARGWHPKLAGLLELGGTWPGAYLLRRGVFMPWELDAVLEPEVVRIGLHRLRWHDRIGAKLEGGPTTSPARVALLEAELYMRNQLLRDTDWASMAHSLEVRVPLVDPALLRRVAPHSLRHALAGKRLLAASPASPLPEGRLTAPQDRLHDACRVLDGPARRPRRPPRAVGAALGADRGGGDAPRGRTPPRPCVGARRRSNAHRGGVRPAVRAIALVTDGFGGHGGIARYNQAFLRAFAGLDGIREVVVVPRSGQAHADELPARLRQLPPAPGKAAYFARVLRAVASRPRFDLLFCGHINMAVVGAAAAVLLRRPWWLQIHGIDAWDPPGRLVRAAVAKADLVTAVSRYTRRRFLAWADLEPHKVRILPNAVEPRYTSGPKPAHLLQRYGLIGKRVLLTVGRLAAAERYKGHDHVIAALAGLRPGFADLVYVVVGDGDDRTRLEALAREFDAADSVLFLGEVPDEELVDHYRMADIFVMLSTGEGFGIVFLEAMACGIPAIGGNVDGSADPLSCSPLGKVVPPEHLAAAIAQMLQNPPRHDQSRALINRFGRAAFAAQLSGLTASFTPAGQRAQVVDPLILGDLRSTRLPRRRSQGAR